jgi:hypothetical protein
VLVLAVDVTGNDDTEKDVRNRLDAVGEVKVEYADTWFPIVRRYVVTALNNKTRDLFLVVVNVMLLCVLNFFFYGNFMGCYFNVYCCLLFSPTKR